MVSNRFICIFQMNHTSMILFQANANKCCISIKRGLEASSSSLSHSLLPGAQVSCEGTQHLVEVASMEEVLIFLLLHTLPIPRFW